MSELHQSLDRVSTSKVNVLSHELSVSMYFMKIWGGGGAKKKKMKKLEVDLEHISAFQVLCPIFFLIFFSVHTSIVWAFSF